MTEQRQRPPAPAFHDGELAVQRRVGVTEAAARLSGMLAPADLRGGPARFLATRTFAALTARDRDGRLWISPLSGPPGFLTADAADTSDASETPDASDAAAPVRGLTVRAVPPPGDPLHALPAGQPAGLLVIDFSTRRRVRLNGTLTAVDGDTLRLDIDQAYGNCPQYIHRRRLEPADPAAAPAPLRHGGALTPAEADLIRRADTFLIGSSHPVHGNDASHRGGPPGFVRLDGDTLWWPDYPGNNMFNTLGNLAVDPGAALLFSDFGTGETVQLSGTAALEWPPPAAPDDDAGTGRRVRFTPASVVTGRLLPARAAA